MRLLAVTTLSLVFIASASSPGFAGDPYHPRWFAAFAGSSG